MSPTEPQRPGISAQMLKEAGVRWIEAEDAFSAIGYRESGLLIPYRTLTGEILAVNGRPFARLRLESPRDGGAKYLSPAKGGCQAYFPPGLLKLLTPGITLGIVEGEFKSMALVEAGFPCVGIGGISSACPKNCQGEPEVLPALTSLIAEVKPTRLAFIGDSDTALIGDFSREALKLAQLARLPVCLPRIPLDAPGKGPDDLRSIWGTEFPVRWQAILDAAELLTNQTTVPALAVRILRRERAALGRLDSDARDKAGERLIRLAAFISDDTLRAAELEKIAVDVLGTTRAVFRAAVKARKTEAAQEADERTAKEAIAELGANGANPLYFDGVNYWRKEADRAFGRLCREDAKLHLNQIGLSRKGDPSPCDLALHSLQVSNRVDYAGPLCGRPPGLHHENGLRVLATRGPEWIPGKPGDCPTITSLLGNLFGLAAGDEHTPTQCAIFTAWLKLAREAVRHPERHSPGQVLALVGPPDCGKSLLQSAIITPALGGRCADPGLFFTGQTEFNADLWGAEHLAIGDKALDVEGSQRITLRNELKRAVAESVYPLHGKCRDGMTFRPVWRSSLSANCDPESAGNLPALDGSFADKIIYLRAYSPPEPFYDNKSPGAREAFAAKLSAELPAFLGNVDAFEIPPEMRKARFGVTEWHHPYILELLGDVDPLGPIAEVLENWISSWPADVHVREEPTVELYRILDDEHDHELNRLRISTGPKHLGHQLAKLATTDAWRERLTRTQKRVGGREANRRQLGWRIRRSAP